MSQETRNKQASRVSWIITGLFVAFVLTIPWSWSQVIRAGLVHTPPLVGVAVEMAGGWFPLMAVNENGDKEFIFFSKAEKKSVVFVKCLFSFVDCRQMAVFRINTPPKHLPPDTFHYRQYGWGTAQIIEPQIAAELVGPDTRNTKSLVIVAIEGTWLSFHVPSIDVLEDVRSIRRVQ